MFGHSSRILRNLHQSHMAKAAAVWEVNRLRRLCRGRLARNAILVLTALPIPLLLDIILWVGDIRYPRFAWEELRGMLLAVSTVAWITAFAVWFLAAISSFEQLLVLWRLNRFARRLSNESEPSRLVQAAERRARAFTGA